MKENQGWREAYNKIIFEQVDINEETIPNFIQQEINKAVLEALQKRDEAILNKIKEYRCHMDEIHCSCMEALVEFINN